MSDLPPSSPPHAFESSPQSLDLAALRTLPLASRESLTRVEDILLSPEATPAELPGASLSVIAECAGRIRQAAARGATVMLLYGAHLLRNGAALLIDRMMERGWLTHLATNGAGTIHDWEYAWLGASTEGVEKNVATGTFGTWNETATAIHAALMGGALSGLGYGRSLGRFICEDGVDLPTAADLRQLIAATPEHPLTAARADLLRALQLGLLQPGRFAMVHGWKKASIAASAWRRAVPMTVHPGIGYDIISNHPIFNGAVLGRAGDWDFRVFGGSLAKAEGGVILSVGSAIMGPQVFEKSLSCVNNLRAQEQRPALAGHAIYVVDLQDGGGWDWSQGEPPKTNPAYYMRFCKSYSRMGGEMRYLQCDNAAFIHHLYRALADGV